MCENDDFFLFVRNLSQTLTTLRKHRESLSSEVGSPTTPVAGIPNGGNPVVSPANRPHPPHMTSALQGRVRLLEQQNSKMEGYISQLKTFTQTVGRGFREGEGEWSFMASVLFTCTFFTCTFSLSLSLSLSLSPAPAAWRNRQTTSRRKPSETGSIRF